ncbi:MAG TPA: hypothetical protein VFY90_12075 [Tepidiformaceae bacterium]|nr:hypothetical protein [Tepidiformaceae bacterium]
MEDPVLYIPILTTVLSMTFTVIILRRWAARGRPGHLAWWAFGVFVFGAGTFFEGYTALFGWESWGFRGWYITGALLGGAPLAQGTVFLLLKRRTALIFTSVLVPFIIVASICVLLTPLDVGKAEEHRLSGDVIEWTWVRGFSPFVNTYAAIFLIGGAIYSAMRYSEQGNTDRMLGNIFIAVGAILPGIGGSFTRAGYTEVLYVTEFIGIILIYVGYRFSVRGRPAGLVATAAATATASGVTATTT